MKINGSSRSLSFPQPTFEFADIFSSIPTAVPKFIPVGTKKYFHDVEYLQNSNPLKESSYGWAVADRKVHECRLNFTTIGKATGCSRDLCQRLVRDIISHLGQQLAIKQTVCISFGLGKVISRSNLVKYLKVCNDWLIYYEAMLAANFSRWKDGVQIWRRVSSSLQDGKKDVVQRWGKFSARKNTRPS